MCVADVCLVIPTYNECENIKPLLAALEQALVGRSWNALFVDDSDDGTDLLIDELSKSDSRIALLHRSENRGGLAGAVVDGLARAGGTYIGVLDADLQHPPAMIPVMLAEARRSTADLVIASRYLPGGGTSGLDGPLRQLVSRSLRSLSKLVFPERLSMISDPLGGFFLIRRSILESARLRPVGYKILLEILVRCQWQNVVEVPYVFQPRQHGASKADFRQGLRFLLHLCILAWDCSPICLVLRPNRDDGPLKDTTSNGLLVPDR